MSNWLVDLLSKGAVINYAEVGVKKPKDVSKDLIQGPEQAEKGYTDTKTVNISNEEFETANETKQIKQTQQPETDKKVVKTPGQHSDEVLKKYKKKFMI